MTHVLKSIKCLQCTSKLEPLYQDNKNRIIYGCPKNPNHGEYYENGKPKQSPPNTKSNKIGNCFILTDSDDDTEYVFCLPIITKQ